ncbi:hypothetical protein [Paraburkholderia sartisoli]|uniref:Uncharacterized protein n=1 Tax=Paraburkholderia sartisoli TaxID=83784 RepID=A0A1H4EJZ4_9BURK|nr:hypothetical protein [Paraburkholderia sartisoli]SEA84910.1 hypothetical protein SAMN05192564_103399 [Paraburkholderia sartisoli]
MKRKTIGIEALSLLAHVLIEAIAGIDDPRHPVTGRHPAGLARSS